MNKKKARTAITPTREEDYNEWYQQVIKEADLAENSPSRGCMVVKPWGYAIWEYIQQELDRQIKATGHENAYFPLFIPLSFFEKEADHVDGFAKECAVVTHHRLEEKEGGGLKPAGPLEEPMIVRPTSEAIIGDAFSRWINSYRDLPLLVNQWANVVRWEMRCRLFLRTAEFLWQEGHTAHETSEEAMDETLKMIGVYQDLFHDYLAIPTILGEKSPSERFPGADATYTLEPMMQDKKALQGCTSHYLGQNFSKAFNIRYNDRNEELKHVYTTSWGLSTRVMGGVIMTHGDDDGLRLPPKIAPYHVVIIPVLNDESKRESVIEYAKAVEKQLSKSTFNGQPVRVKLDLRDFSSAEKKWQWTKKGVPLRVEVGPRDISENKCVLNRRDMTPRDKEFLTVEDLSGSIEHLLNQIQANYFQQASDFLNENIVYDIESLEQLREYFSQPSPGFVWAGWCGDESTEELLKDLKVTIRCIPSIKKGNLHTCVLTGKPATTEVVIARSY